MRHAHVKALSNMPAHPLSCPQFSGTPAGVVRLQAKQWTLAPAFFVLRRAVSAEPSASACCAFELDLQGPSLGATLRDHVVHGHTLAPAAAMLEACAAALGTLRWGAALFTGFAVLEALHLGTHAAAGKHRLRVSKHGELDLCTVAAVNGLVRIHSRGRAGPGVAATVDQAGDRASHIAGQPGAAYLAMLNLGLLLDPATGRSSPACMATVQPPAQSANYALSHPAATDCSLQLPAAGAPRSSSLRVPVGLDACELGGRSGVHGCGALFFLARAEAKDSIDLAHVEDAAPAGRARPPACRLSGLRVRELGSEPGPTAQTRANQGITYRALLQATDPLLVAQSGRLGNPILSVLTQPWMEHEEGESTAVKLLQAPSFPVAASATMLQLLQGFAGQARSGSLALSGSSAHWESMAALARVAAGELNARISAVKLHRNGATSSPSASKLQHNMENDTYGAEVRGATLSRAKLLPMVEQALHHAPGQEARLLPQPRGSLSSLRWVPIASSMEPVETGHIEVRRGVQRYLISCRE